MYSSASVVSFHSSHWWHLSMLMTSLVYNDEICFLCVNLWLSMTHISFQKCRSFHSYFININWHFQISFFSKNSTCPKLIISLRRILCFLINLTSFFGFLLFSLPSVHYDLKIFRPYIILFVMNSVETFSVKRFNYSLLIIRLILLVLFQFHSQFNSGFQYFSLLDCYFWIFHLLINFLMNKNIGDH